jgi:hypothetical protein
MHIDARVVILVATIAWFVAAVALAIGWNWVDGHGHRIWLWTCLWGGGLGLAGLLLMGRHRSEGRL